MFAKLKRVLKKENKKKEDDLREDIKNEGGLEKKDIPAMLISAYLIIIPVCLAVLLILCLLMLLIFGFFKN